MERERRSAEIAHRLQQSSSAAAAAVKEEEGEGKAAAAAGDVERRTARFEEMLRVPREEGPRPAAAGHRPRRRGLAARAPCSGPAAPPPPSPPSTPPQEREQQQKPAATAIQAGSESGLVSRTAPGESDRASPPPPVTETATEAAKGMG